MSKLLESMAVERWQMANMTNRQGYAAMTPAIWHRPSLIDPLQETFLI